MPWPLNGKRSRGRKRKDLDPDGRIDGRRAYRYGVRDGEDLQLKHAFTEDPGFFSPGLGLIHAQFKSDLERIQQECIVGLSQIIDEDIEAEMSLENEMATIRRTIAAFGELSVSISELKPELEAPNGSAGAAPTGLTKKQAKFKRLDLKLEELETYLTELPGKVTATKLAFDAGPRRWQDRRDHYRAEATRAHQKALEFIQHYRSGLIRSHPRGREIANEWTPPELKLDLYWLEETMPGQFIAEARAHIDDRWQQILMAVPQNRQPSAAEPEQDDE